MRSRLFASRRETEFAAEDRVEDLRRILRIHAARTEDYLAARGPLFSTLAPRDVFPITLE